MRHGDQRAEKLQQAEMDALLEEGEDRADAGGAQGRLCQRQQELSLDEMDIVPLVNAWLLIAHTKKLQGFQPLRTGFLKTLKDSWYA